MEWVDSNPIPWTPYGLFFGWQPSHFFIPHPLWNPYGIHMECPWNGASDAAFFFRLVSCFVYTESVFHSNFTFLKSPGG
jgi:hypothetical protein